MRRTSVLVAGLLIAVGGCAIPGNYEGGSFYSQDKHVYVSRAHFPVTVSVIDTRDQQTIWTYDLPVGQKLICRFYTNRNKDNPALPDQMQWRIVANKQTLPGDKGTLAVPPADARLMKPTYRSSPEYPAGGDAHATGRVEDSPD